MHLRHAIRARRASLAASSVAVAALVAGTAVAIGPQAAAGAPAAAAAAGTGTITYVRGHNVYVADQDGSSPRQVTSGGTAANPWYSPTESDDGHIIAGRGNLIYRMDQWGTVLNTIDPPDLRSGGNQVLGGRPTNIAVSPNGATIAYSYTKNYCSTTNVCRPWPVTGFTSSTRLTDPSVYGTTYGDTPSWVSNSRVVLDGWGPFDNIYLYELGRGTVNYYWFDDDNIHGSPYKNVTDVEISRGVPYAVAIRGQYDKAQVAFLDLRSTGNFRTGIPSVPGTDSLFCQTSEFAGMTSPTWSADGSVVAWEMDPGVIMVPNDEALKQCDPGPAEIVVPGGSQPSFSKARLQTTRPVYSFAVKAEPRVAGKAVAGKTLAARPASLSPSPTTVKYQWLRDKKAIKRATKARYKITKKDRRHKLSVRVTASRPGFRTVVVTSKPIRISR